MGELRYAALIGDLVTSRATGDRPRVQHELRELLPRLNDSLGAESLAAGFVLTAGDEVQALFRAPSRAVEAIRRVTDRLSAAPFEQGIAFGLGYGRLSTEELPPAPAQAENVALLDGPCFHLAREGLEAIKKEKSWVRARGFGAREDVVVDGLFELMAAIRGGWTAKQGWYALQTRELEQQKKVAELSGVSPSVVSESLKAAHFEAILKGERAARRLLESFDPEGAARA